MGKKPAIAIIDSGVDQYEKGAGIAFAKNDSDEIIMSDCFPDENGHGTIVYNIISSIVPEAVLYTVKIFSQEECVDSELLVAALEFLCNEIKPDIVHMSLGVSFCEDIPRLRNICEELTRNGSILIAAYDNDGSLSYPAVFPFVIGVDTDRRILKTHEYYYVLNSCINIQAIGVSQRLKGIGGRCYDVAGSSFAAPYITSIIASGISSGKVQSGVDSAFSYLRDNAKVVLDAGTAEKNIKPFPISKAILFPYNKEISTLIRYRSSILFSVHQFCDVKYLGNIGEKVIDGTNDKILISPVEKVNWDDDFDTVILGHTDQLSSITGKDYRSFIIQKCAAYHKNLYSFDALSNEQKKLLESSRVKYYSPIVTRRNIPNNAGKLRQIGKPIICVAGTSPRQGKFSLQMILKQKLEQHIKVGMLSTEPHGYLLGADQVFSMGYSSTVDLDNPDDFICAVNHCIGKVEDTGCDLILTGLQSQTIPAKVCNVRDMVLRNHYFVLGTNPDAFLLMVNVFDEPDYIKKTIQYLESIVSCDVLAVVLFPVSRQIKWGELGDLIEHYSRDVLEKTAQELKKALNREVFILDNDRHMEHLCRLCLEYFMDR